MQGITIISSIIAAVCVFQTTEAGLLDTWKESLPYPLEKLGNVQNVIKSNPLEICPKAYNDGIKAINQVKETFGTCFSDKTNPDTNTNIQHLSDKLNKLQASISEAYEKAMKCFNKITTLVPCLNNVIQTERSVLSHSLEDAIDAAKKVLDMSSKNLRNCYDKAIETSQETFDTLGKNGKECANSIKNIFSY